MRVREEKESVETRSRCSRGAPISCKQGELAGGNCVHSLNKCVSQSRLVPKESSTPLQGDFKVPVFHKFIVGNHRVQRGDPIFARISRRITKSFTLSKPPSQGSSVEVTTTSTKKHSNPPPTKTYAPTLGARGGPAARGGVWARAAERVCLQVDIQYLQACVK